MRLEGKVVLISGAARGKDNSGSVVGDLQKRRATIESTSHGGEIHRVTGLVPLASMFAYTTALRSMTALREADRRTLQGFVIGRPSSQYASMQAGSGPRNS